MNPLYRRSQVIVWLLIALIGIAVISTLLTYSWIQYIQNIISGIPFDDDRTDLLQKNNSLIQTIQSGLSLTLVVVFLLWFYRSHQNLTAGGLSGLRYTHGWAVGGFFIPFLNLVLPYRAMSEVYKGSVALTDEMKIESWQSLPISPQVKWWWALFLTRVASNGISNRMAANIDSFNEVLRASWFSFATLIVGIPAALITIILVRNITRMQTKAQSSRYVIKLYPGGV